MAFISTHVQFSFTIAVNDSNTVRSAKYVKYLQKLGNLTCTYSQNTRDIYMYRPTGT